MSRSNGATTAPPVALVPWPTGTTARSRARAAGTPCLLVVDPGAAPPTDCTLLEDWVSAAAPDPDVRARIDGLARRPAPAGAVALGAQIASTLTDVELRAFGTLDGRPGRVTPRRRVAGAVGPLPGDPLSAVLRRLDRAIHGAGLELLEVGGGDVLLVRRPAAAATAVQPGARGANSSRATPSGSRNASPEP